jgi:hypothetical protein
MTREEQLKFCSVCKNRKMDMRQGMLCGLTDAKADFEDKCENYVEDVAQIIKQENEEKEYQESLGVSGWLAFFLWVGVGVGALVSCIWTIVTVYGAGVNALSGALYAIYTMGLATIAVLTIKAFYQRATNAVALALTYIAMVAIDGLLGVVLYFIFDDVSMLSNVRQLVWATIWLSYLLMSIQVENLIPRQTRTWKLPEKIILGLYTLACVMIVLSLNSFIKNPTGGDFYDPEFVIDSTIDAYNEQLGLYSTPECTVLEIVKEKGKIVYSYRLNNVTETLDPELTGLLTKQAEDEVLAAFEASDAIALNELNLFYDNGYELCYRYLNANDELLYTFDISLEEFKEAVE